MSHAIVCNFDPELENEVRKIWREFKAEGINMTPWELEARPYITFSLHEEMSPDLLMDTIDNQVIKEMSVQLSSFGAFTTQQEKLILFLSVTPSFKILSFHKQLHDYFDANNIDYDPLYAPENWIPHCTLALDMNREQFNKGVNICLGHNRNLKGRITRVSVVEVFPVKELMSRKLIY